MLQSLRTFAVSSLLAAGTACGSSPPPPEAPAAAEPVAPEAAPEPALPPPDAPSPETGAGTGTGASRPALTAEECAAQQGTAVGDIGDGAIHRPDYVCPGGKAPLGNISAAPDGPVAVEGEVCCPN